MYHTTRGARLCLALSVISFTACSGAKRATSPTMTGNLLVTITTANGITPSVTVTGPNAYTKTITSTQVLTNLAIGDYSVAADSVVQADSVIGTIVDTVGFTGNPASVQAGDTTKVTVTYAVERRTGALWVVNQATDTNPEYASSQLHASGTPAPAMAFKMEAGAPNGMALDAHGDLWESDANDTLFMYTLAARGSPDSSASLKLWYTGFGTPASIAFDAQGNLWLADQSNGSVDEFTATQLAAGGSQTPALQLDLVNGGASPFALAFDTAGDLWVSDIANNDIVGYTPSQLTTTGPSCTPSPPTCDPTPADTIGSNSNSIETPTGVAFDSKGNLWVTNYTGTIVEYTPAQTALNAAPAPHVTITAPSGAAPDGLAFDNSGSLWVTDVSGANNGAIYAFGASQIAITGSPSPKVTISGALGEFTPAQLVFDQGSTVQVSASRVRDARPRISHLGRMNPILQRAANRR